MDRLLEATRRAERTHFWFRGFRRFVRPSLARAAGAYPSATLLDCGCGTGANLTLLNRFGRAYGIDLSPTGIRLTRASDIPRVGRASVDRLPFPDTTFDIVTSFDVLYCLPNQAERQGIAEMFRVLRPGGFALINVPALDGLRGHHSVLSQGIRRYRPSTLRALVERAGFEIERLTFTNASLVPVMLPVRFIQRLTGLSEERAETDIRVPPAPVNALLSGLLAIEAMLMRWTNMPIGSSLLCLARKPRRGQI